MCYIVKCHHWKISTQIGVHQPQILPKGTYKMKNIGKIWGFVGFPTKSTENELKLLGLYTRMIEYCGQ